MYEAVIERCKKKGHCIIVIAEGAYHGLIEEDQRKVSDKAGKKGVSSSGPWESPDAKREAEFVDLASFIKGDLNSYAGKEHNIKCTIKYLDPKKAIRAFPANSTDTSICHTLAHSACHSAMAGFTDFANGIVRG